MIVFISQMEHYCCDKINAFAILVVLIGFYLRSLVIVVRTLLYSGTK